jgi:hypothetical protein
LVRRFQELGTLLNLQDSASCWDSNLARYPVLIPDLLFRVSESFPEFVLFPGSLPELPIPVRRFPSVRSLLLNPLYRIPRLRRPLLPRRHQPAFQKA